MDEREAGQGQSSRRAHLRALPTPVDVDLYIQDAPPLLDVIGDLPEPRIADLDALLREVDGLRSSLRRDLGLAATAAEAGADDLAGWLLLNEDGRVRSFEERALAHLHNLEASEAVVEDEVEPPAAAVPAQRRMRRMMPAAPLVAACAAVFGFLVGVPAASTPSSPSTSNVALESYVKLTDLAMSGASDKSIKEAAEQFHEDLAPLVAAAAANPAAAQKAIALLQSERMVIAAQSGNSPALRAVLREADLLVARLRASLAPRKPVRRPLLTVPVAPQQEENRRTSETKSSPAPKASPSASPAPKPSPSASPAPKPSPSSTAKPSPSPSSDDPLPTTPLEER